ncbi:MAG: hypothetical protein HOQ24_00955 [Mycobacteriaceae bacterium]|nr:hypothetical protein [Mycobacteriaceae bacterium]
MIKQMEITKQVGTSAEQSDDLRVFVDRGVAIGTARDVRERIGPALGRVSDQILSAYVRVTRIPGQVMRPIFARANINVSGRLVSVHVVGATPDEAVDLLADRVDRRLRRAAALNAGCRANSTS